MSCLEFAPRRDGSPYLFAADWGDGHFIGVVRVLDRVCTQAKLKDVTPHVLRHTFASVAGDLGFSELTIAGLLGHCSAWRDPGIRASGYGPRGCRRTSSARIAELLDGVASGTEGKRGSRKEVAGVIAA